MASYFDNRTFAFLQDLAANNDRTWFQEHRDRYEAHVKAPALELIQDLGAPFAAISSHFHVGPRSLFRVHRDVRFSKDKRPYKTTIGLHFRHDAGRDAHAPGYYLHVEPGGSFVGLGMWHPDGTALRKVRDRIVESPEVWREAVGDEVFRDTFELEGERLKRAPRGYDADHPLIEDLKRKDFIGGHKVPDSFVLDRELPDRLTSLFAAGTPFMRFLCEAVGVAF